MWRRNLGIVLVVGASLLLARTVPNLNHDTSPLADKAFHFSGRAGTPFTIPFAVREDALYQVAVSYRYTPQSMPVDGKPFVEPQFLCEFWDTGPLTTNNPEITRADVYTPTPFIRQSAFLRASQMTVRYDSDGRTYLLGPFPLEAGHRYNASLITLRGHELLEGRDPRVQVVFARPRASRSDWYTVRNAAGVLACGVLLLLGLLLTLWGGSRLPICGGKSVK